jgi:lambda repressor-like predicted transcriptional regulator
MKRKARAPSPRIQIRLDPKVIAAARTYLGLGDGVPAAQVVRLAVESAAGGGPLMEAQRRDLAWFRAPPGWARAEVRNPGQREAWAARERERGMRANDIAAALGVPSRTVRRDLARVHKRQERMAAAVRLRAEGLSLRAVARRLGVTEGTVRADLANWTKTRMAADRLRNVEPALRSGSEALDYAAWEAELQGGGTGQPAGGAG